MTQAADELSRLPGQSPVRWRKEQWRTVVAAIAGACWPPLILTLPLFPPEHLGLTGSIDWRLVVLVIGLITVPIGLWLIGREREATGRPATRLGIVWRFMFYGSLLAVGLMTITVLVIAVLGWFEAGSFLRAVGFTETAVLIYGVGGLPIAMLVGVSYALWAGLCAAFIAFEHAPEVTPDRIDVVNRAVARPHRRF